MDKPSKILKKMGTVSTSIGLGKVTFGGLER